MIIVGLGNPGAKYEGTFHNCGYGVVDALAEKLGKRINKIECSSLVSVSESGGEKLILAKPTTYMNLSGKAVKSLISKYDEKGGELIVCYDDIDIDRFSVRVRASGSAGTHNGMRNIISMLGRDDFKRVRIGIGRPDYDLADYVLSKPNKEDEKKFNETFCRVADLLAEYIKTRNFDKFLREGNSIK